MSKDEPLKIDVHRFKGKKSALLELLDSIMETVKKTSDSTSQHDFIMKLSLREVDF